MIINKDTPDGLIVLWIIKLLLSFITGCVFFYGLCRGGLAVIHILERMATA